MLSAHIDSLKQAIEAKFHCACDYAGTEFVHEKDGGETLWRGSVDCFILQEGDSADKVYAWRSRNEAGDSSFVIVPGTSDVKSAQEAVRWQVTADPQTKQGRYKRKR